jgi:hypothetical protein
MIENVDSLYRQWMATATCQNLLGFAVNCGIEANVQVNILLLRRCCVKSRPRDNKNVIKSGTVAGRSAIPWLSTISVHSDLE